MFFCFIIQAWTAPQKPSTHTGDPISNLYLFEYDPTFAKPNQSSDIGVGAKDDEFIRIKLRKENSTTSNKEDTRLEVLFARCEALHVHGFTEQACILAEILADYMLTNAPSSLFYSSTTHDGGVGQMEVMVSSVASSNTTSGSKLVGQNEQVFASGSSNSGNKSSGLRQKCLTNFQGKLESGTLQKLILFDSKKKIKI